MISHRPVNKKSFLQHVADLCANDNTKFQEEYAVSSSSPSLGLTLRMPRVPMHRGVPLTTTFPSPGASQAAAGPGHLGRRPAVEPSQEPLHQHQTVYVHHTLKNDSSNNNK